MPFVVIIADILVLVSVANLIEEYRRRFIYASIATGAMGSLVFFILLAFFNETQEPIVTFFGSVLVGTLVLALMNMSGFKEK